MQHAYRKHVRRMRKGRSSDEWWRCKEMANNSAVTVLWSVWWAARGTADGQFSLRCHFDFRVLWFKNTTEGSGRNVAFEGVVAGQSASGTCSSGHLNSALAGEFGGPDLDELVLLPEKAEWVRASEEVEERVFFPPNLYNNKPPHILAARLLYPIVAFILVILIGIVVTTSLSAKFLYVASQLFRCVPWFKMLITFYLLCRGARVCECASLAIREQLGSFLLPSGPQG